MEIGINLWLAPQISEHCPKKIPVRFKLNLIWFNRPGEASILTPEEGIVQEWITSAEDVNKRIWDIYGKIVRLSTSRRRKLNLFKFCWEIIYESNSNFLKSEYS